MSFSKISLGPSVYLKYKRFANSNVNQVKVKKVFEWSNQCNGQKSKALSSNSNSVIICSGDQLLYKNHTKLHDIYNNNQLLVFLFTFWECQSSVFGAPEWLQWDDTHSYRHLKGCLTYLSGSWHWPSAGASAVNVGKMLYVACTSLQHGSQIPGGSTARDQARCVAFLA